MAVLTSRMAAAIDALVTAATEALPGAVVIDGPFAPWMEFQADATRRLFIGTTDPYGDGESIAADGDQAFRTIGGRWRDETFTIRCLAEGWNGSNNLKQARDDAVAITAGVELMLRPTQANPTAYALTAGVLWAGIGAESITSEYNAATGVYVRLDFSISCRANLTQ